LIIVHDVGRLGNSLVGMYALDTSTALFIPAFRLCVFFTMMWDNTSMDSRARVKPAQKRIGEGVMPMDILAWKRATTEVGL
jgi:hypothetical protein